MIWAYTTNLSYYSLHQWKIKYISLTIFLNVFIFNHCVRVQFALHFLQLWVQSNCEKIPINAKVLGKRAICISQILLFFLVHVTTLMEKWWILDVPNLFHDNEFTHMSQWTTCWNKQFVQTWRHIHIYVYESQYSCGVNN